ncbi:type II toxin-antitoxin system RelE family toxin [Ignatzschineria cameli]|uniref:Type II toxin-antitoxin system mRNA interferase toxin, RelE/StbE family n=1 Tax=Ignatzschineria cameli TaxID=2182793 RepID=A0A2U2AL49_9GAMM|nr:type II toxin-antitoxin system RelE/ParE family toxin [Ignatzschineria cameli]PWD83940.1 type II toxin-antitoxin system mRNA interferase toxin, RelE/StbE family [Ignatzschineria cameli]
MVWKVEYSNKVLKVLKKIDKTHAKRIVDVLELQIAQLDDPRIRGKALNGNFKNLWRYRVGDYRIICDIQDNQLTILALFIGHRKRIYR